MSQRDPIADALTEVPVRVQTRHGVTTLTPSSALRLAQHLRDRRLIIETKGAQT